jgi:GT2 family glycosyltransferase
VKTAAAIVNWNSGAFLRRCLASLVSGISEIVVVDNASDDNSLDLAAEFEGRVKFIRNPQNLGFAAGVNLGFSTTTAPYVLILNPDVQAVADAVQTLQAFLDAHPEAGAVGGHVNAKYLPRPLATPWTLIRENLGIPVSSLPANPSEIEQAAAAALMIRRDAYDRIGGFDERFYPAWYEDVDFCKRLKAVGWQIHFLPESRFLHEGGYSAAALGPEKFAAAYYRNQLRYVAKHYGKTAGLAVRASLVAGMLGRILAGPARAGAYTRVIAGALGGW